MITFIIINFIINLYFFIRAILKALYLLFKKYWPLLFALLQKLRFMIWDVERFKPEESEEKEEII